MSPAQAAYEAWAKAYEDECPWTKTTRELRTAWQQIANAARSAPTWSQPPLCPCGHQRAAHDGRGCTSCACERALHSLPRTLEAMLDAQEEDGRDD